MHKRRRRVASAVVQAAAAFIACFASPASSRADEAAAKTVISGTTGAVAGPVPYWQAPPVPGAVIQGGAIPAGWQPQAVPYQGIGPDGRPMTMYVAPTYVFTYQAGPPVLATTPVNRRAPAGAPGAAPYGAYGWNYQAQGANAVPVALPPPTVTRYQPAPYQFPADSRALGGTPIVPPSTPLPGPPQPVPAPPAGFTAPPMPQQPLAAPPAQWVPVNQPPANVTR